MLHGYDKGLLGAGPRIAAREWAEELAAYCEARGVSVKWEVHDGGVDVRIQNRPKRLSLEVLGTLTPEKLLADMGIAVGEPVVLEDPPVGDAPAQDDPPAEVPASETIIAEPEPKPEVEEPQPVQVEDVPPEAPVEVFVAEEPAQPEPETPKVIPLGKKPPAKEPLSPEEPSSPDGEIQPESENTEVAEAATEAEGPATEVAEKDVPPEVEPEAQAGE